MTSKARSVVAISVATTLAACAGAFPVHAAAAVTAAAPPTSPTSPDPPTPPASLVPPTSPVPALGASPPAAVAARAAAEPVRWVCHGPASVFDTPGGIVIGILAQGDHVRVLMRAAGHPQWVMVHGPIEINGWMRAGALC
jgi:hypothetical protein